MRAELHDRTALIISEEIEEETYARMQALQNESEQPFQELSDLLEAELEYHSKCREVLEELRDAWPSGYVPIPGPQRRRGFLLFDHWGALGNQ
jgi:hypothetical protein